MSYFAVIFFVQVMPTSLTLQGYRVNTRMDNISFILHSSALPIERT